MDSARPIHPRNRPIRRPDKRNLVVNRYGTSERGSCLNHGGCHFVWRTVDGQQTSILQMLQEELSPANVVPRFLRLVLVPQRRQGLSAGHGETSIGEGWMVGDRWSLNQEVRQSVVIGHWSLVICQLSLVRGPWPLDQKVEQRLS